MTTITNQQLKSTLVEIVNDVTRAHPLGQFELHLRSRAVSHGQCLKGCVVDVLVEFNTFCSQFPAAVMRYAPKHEYGALVDIICVCDRAKTTCPVKCRSKAERPRALLLLTHDGVEDILLGRHAPPRS